MSQILSFTLPYPPSLNTYWRHVGNKTLLSEEGRVYRANVSKELILLGRSGPFTGRLALDAFAHPPDLRRRDLDNMLKAILDALPHGGVYLDDSQIDQL